MRRLLFIGLFCLLPSAAFAQGIPRVVPTDTAGTQIPLATTTEVQQDVAYTISALKSLMDFCRASTATPSSVSADDKAVVAWCLRDGRRMVSMLDPCSSEVKSSTAISQTARTVIVAAASSKKTYICSITLSAATTEIVSVVEGTGTTCQTSTVAIAGSTTAANGITIATGVPLAISAGGATVLSGTGTNVDVCLVPSGSNRVSGWVTWVQK